MVDKIQVATLIGTINFVPQDRVPKVRQMNPNLVHASSDRACLHQRHGKGFVGMASEHTELGAAGCPICMDALLHINLRMSHLTLAKKWRVQVHVLPRWPTAHNSEIRLMNVVFLHGHAEPPRTGRSLRDQHRAARFPVQAIDDGNLPAIGDLVGQQVFDSMPQGQRAIRFARMDLQRGRLVHDDVLISLVQNSEGGIDSTKHRHRSGRLSLNARLSKLWPLGPFHQHEIQHHRRALDFRFLHRPRRAASAGRYRRCAAFGRSSRQNPGSSE